jgi:hypothetical protein
MLERYWLYQRSNGIFYLEDRTTGKQESLRTKDRGAAKQVAAARNQAAAQPTLNTVMAKAYLQAKSPEMMTRTWLEVMRDMEAAYTGSSLHRWKKHVRSEPFRLLYGLTLLATESDHFLRVLRHPRAGSSANKALRILQNRALDLGWLLTPVLSKRAWPKIQPKPKRAIKPEEHARLIETEWDQEWRDYLEMLWEVGGSQTDMANLHADNVQAFQHRVVYQRMKLRGRTTEKAALVIGERLAALLARRPKEGWLFPKLHERTETVRASRFRKRCLGLGIKGVSLHSYRYAWAQRAKIAGMPAREAMSHLGHKSRAVHFAYCEGAEIVTLPLEYYEKEQEKKLLAFSTAAA